MFVIIVETVLEFVTSARNEGPPIKCGVIYGYSLTEVERSNIIVIMYQLVTFLTEKEMSAALFVSCPLSFSYVRPRNSGGKKNLLFNE